VGSADGGSDARVTAMTLALLPLEIFSAKEAKRTDGVAAENA